MRVLCLALGALFLSAGAAAAAESPPDACGASVAAATGERILACTDLILAGQSPYTAHIERAAAYAEAGNPDAALADLTTAIALAPNSAPAYSARGALYLREEEFRDGLVDLDRALQLAPGDADTLRTRAFAWDELQNYPAAIADYGALLALTGDPTYRYFRGFAYLHHGDDALAASDFAAIVDANSPTLSAWAHRGMAGLHLKEGALTAALADYNAALAADPSDDRAFAGRCQVSAALGEPGEGCAGLIKTSDAR